MTNTLPELNKDTSMNKTVTLSADFVIEADNEAIAIELCRKALAQYIPQPSDQRRVLDYLTSRAMSEMYATQVTQIGGTLAQTAGTGNVAL